MDPTGRYPVPSSTGKPDNWGSDKETLWKELFSEEPSGEPGELLALPDELRDPPPLGLQPSGAAPPVCMAKWTERQESDLVYYKTKGFTYSQIATLLGGVKTAVECEERLKEIFLQGGNTPHFQDVLSLELSQTALSVNVLPPISTKAKRRILQLNWSKNPKLDVQLVKLKIISKLPFKDIAKIMRGTEQSCQSRYSTLRTKDPKRYQSIVELVKAEASAAPVLSPEEQRDSVEITSSSSGDPVIGRKRPGDELEGPDPKKARTV